MRASRAWLAAALGLALAACGGGGSKDQDGPVTPPPSDPPGDPVTPPPPPPPPPVDAPVVKGDFTFYGPPQGLPATVWDVSADEGGNVYVAAGEAVLAKGRTDRDFERFDPAAAGLTPSCDEARTQACPITAVAGRDAGKAVLGYEGAGKYDDDNDPLWMRRSGGLDLVTFDGTTLAKERHVEVGSPPHTVCYAWLDDAHTTCHPLDMVWLEGRFKTRTIQRLAVNHDTSRPLSYGDVMISGQHGTLSILVADPAGRRWPDLIKGAAGYDETYGVWEHHHPDNYLYGRLLTGEGWAVAIDPTTNVPWFANQFRLGSMPAYATTARPSSQNYWGPIVPDRPYIAIWEPDSNPDDEALRDNVTSISFCDDGTMWVGSYNHGLARLPKDAAEFEQIAVPGGAGGALSVACDPSDGSLWVGFSWGGFGRLAGGTWRQLIDPSEIPSFARGPVLSIQIDRWSSPRVVYLAHRQSSAGPGGVTAYAGP